MVRPDTSRFRADLEAQLKSVVARPIKVPVVPVAGPAFAAAIAGTAALTAAQQQAAASTVVTADALATATTISRQYTGAIDLAAVATTKLAVAQETEAVTAAQATAAQAAHARSVSNVARGAAASGLTLFGLRGATLAASAAFLGGTAAVVGFSKAVQSAASLETELNIFRVTAGATADEMNRVSASAQQLGRDITLPGVTAGDAAEAMTELAKAGLSVRDSLDAARGTLQLSTAAQISNVQATNLVAGALNSFELAGRDAVRVADLLAGAAKESQGDIADMGTALAQAAAVSNQFGVSIEDTITLLTELAQAGIAGGRAGTSLRVAFLRLVNPPADAAKALKELNVQIRDANGNLRPQIFTDIQKALQGYTKAQQDATLATIFGADAIRTAGIIGNKGADAFTRTRDAVTEVGLAQEQAAARTQGLQGDFENLSNQASALGLTIGNVAKGPVSVFVKSVADSVATVNDGVAGMVSFGSAIGGLGSSIANTIPFVDEFASKIGVIVEATSFLNPALAPFKAAAGLAGVFGDNAEEAGEQAKVFGNIVNGVTQSVDGLAKALQQARSGLREQLPQQDTGLGVKQIQNIVGGFDAKAVRARIHADNQELLAALNSEQTFLEKQLQRQFVQRRPALKRALEQSLLGVVSDIRVVQSQAQAAADKVKRDSEQAARDAAAAVAAQEQDLLSQFGLARDQQQNRIAAAAATTAVTDDIKAQKKLAALVRDQIAAVRERITVEGGRKEAITALRAILIQVNQSLDGLAKQQQAAQAERRQQLLQGINLDIDFAQINDNQTAEVNARKRLIAKLRDELALVKKGTNAYKEIRNAIAEQNKAIAEITAEKRKQGQSFAQASFEFLQAQQGFASNLLGNLIPSGATGGLVGGSVQGALAPVSSFADGQSKSGPTAGQAQTTNAKLQVIIDQLTELNGGTKAPEATRQRRASGALMDGPGGGFGGG